MKKGQESKWFDIANTARKSFFLKENPKAMVISNFQGIPTERSPFHVVLGT